MSMINNALSGALAAQAALAATSQNIANLQTPGYTRQGILLRAAAPTGSMSPGNGVQTPQLIRFADAYKSQQLWESASTQGRHAAVQGYLTQLEQVMGDDVSTINAGLDDFYAALNAASVEPTSAPLRQQVIASAEALTVRFNSMNQVLANQRTAITQQRAAVLDQVNVLSAEIATLNGKIAGAGAAGANPSALIDERDNRIDALAALVGVNVVDQADGSRSVALKNGTPLVVGTTVGKLEAAAPLADGTPALTVRFAKEVFTIASRNMGGQLGGLDDYQAKTLQPLTQSISDMAAGLTTLFNNQLAAGYGLDGTPGKPLFQLDTSSVSALLTITPGITAQDLGFSGDATKPGDSANLLALIDLKDQSVPIASLGTVQLGDAYTQLVSNLGTTSQQNQAALSVADTVRSYAKANWASTSGVNEDEEAVNLVQYQQMYQANMKVFSTANTLFEATLAILR
ncbi:flagellar hook-associated protein 1 [Pseudorhodoferax aquiterrae]|uniref:Flagellar hook-associated protein 1 n=1 Tax=Pseudorhodoferax aquiterrae TaxID=747304 RepID=A0ABQ3GFZ6_9BURK|nr:flagellar hook-associated protein FlgK [Pseudorhodoferax aquiterrae]GHD03228.1 flagellar hook-associated protein 1 [Pseudorhodoferax aquiterrae]